MPDTGKTQSYSRLINNRLVIKALRDAPRSATSLANELDLSNATLSSILSSLSKQGIIEIAEHESKKKVGRKRVYYRLNESFGLILTIQFSDQKGIVSLCNLREEILAIHELDIPHYDLPSFYETLMKASSLMMDPSFRPFPVRCIVLSLAARVDKAGMKILPAVQFDQALFSTEDFMLEAVKRQFPGVPVLLTNDIDAASLGEQRRGVLQHVNNAAFVSIDSGIGGSLFVNGSLFQGDHGFLGEYGLIVPSKETEPLDSFCSLRVLAEKATQLLSRPVDDEELAALFEQEPSVKELILDSARILGSALKKLYLILDISTFVLGGRVAQFGLSYLEAVKEGFGESLYTPSFAYSSLGASAKIIGSLTIGADYIFAVTFGEE